MYQGVRSSPRVEYRAAVTEEVSSLHYVWHYSSTQAGLIRRFNLRPEICIHEAHHGLVLSLWCPLLRISFISIFTAFDGTLKKGDTGKYYQVRTHRKYIS